MAGYLDTGAAEMGSWPQLIHVRTTKHSVKQGGGQPSFTNIQFASTITGRALVIIRLVTAKWAVRDEDATGAGHCWWRGTSHVDFIITSGLFDQQTYLYIYIYSVLFVIFCHV